MGKIRVEKPSYLKLVSEFKALFNKNIKSFRLLYVEKIKKLEGF